MFLVLGVSSVHHPERVLGEFGEVTQAIQCAERVATSDDESYELVVVVDEHDDVVWRAAS